MRRPLNSYSKEVLIAWIEARGFSYFDEELEEIEGKLGRERKERESEEKREWTRELAELQRAIEDEIRIYRLRGSAWTPFRPFVNCLEAVGNARCGCRRDAKFISYSTELRACVVRCRRCRLTLGPFVENESSGAASGDRL